MSEPPTLEKLSGEVEISLKNLKEGFKKVYGNTVFGYLYEWKNEFELGGVLFSQFVCFLFILNCFIQSS